jgi:hypothetical protein
VLNPATLAVVLAVLAAAGLFEPHVLVLVGVLMAFNSWLLEERLLAGAASTRPMVFLSRAIYAAIGAIWLQTTVAL